MWEYFEKLPCVNDVYVIYEYVLDHYVFLEPVFKKKTKKKLIYQYIDIGNKTSIPMESTMHTLPLSIALLINH